MLRKRRINNPANHRQQQRPKAGPLQNNIHRTLQHLPTTYVRQRSRPTPIRRVQWPSKRPNPMWHHPNTRRPPPARRKLHNGRGRKKGKRAQSRTISRTLRHPQNLPNTRHSPRQQDQAQAHHQAQNRTRKDTHLTQRGPTANQQHIKHTIRPHRQSQA